jgi:predicted AAA+ superfamily ATPase
VKRKIEKALLEWKNQNPRQPLIVYGARQTGKTYTIKQFGEQHYVQLAYFNFEEQKDIRKAFERTLDPSEILRQLEAFSGQRISRVPGEALLVFDEVQACPDAITSMKYFEEKLPGLHLIATGSLLGVATRQQGVSFPVGKVTFLRMFPLDFEEFLWSCDGELLASLIRESYDACAEFTLHDTALAKFDDYQLLGGMPAVVNTFTKEFSLQDATAVKWQILNAYYADMSKYSSAIEASRNIAAFESLPAQLSKDNRKFQYKLIQKGAKSSLFGDALNWLEQAGVTLRCKLLEQPSLPFRAHVDLSAFKLYAGDCGILTALMGIGPREFYASDIDSVQRGALAENYVATVLGKTNSIFSSELFYWRSDSKTGGKAEVDFIIKQDAKSIPVEVKSGLRTRSRSLSVYQNRFKPDYAIRISRKNFGMQNGIASIPLYAAHCIKPDSPDE